MYSIKLTMLPDEYWYGLAALEGSRFPISAKSSYSYCIDPNPGDNQAAPILISNKGRYIYCDSGISVNAEKGELTVSSTKSQPISSEGHENLRGAFLAASSKHFPANSKLPPRNFFEKPQYNTWIELLREQTQVSVLRYAESILKNGLPPGILMIDDGWADYYGGWRFNRVAFPDPKAMMDELHAMGFEVMLWTCPFVSPDSREYMYLFEEGLLVKTANGKPAIREWWNGYSSELDLTNPKAADWYYNELMLLVNNCGVDGFKFDAGDSLYYADDDITFKPTDANGQCELWGNFGERFPFNEFRAGYRCQGRALVQRLADRAHSWDFGGIASLMPNLLTQGIMGYAFTCPDMIGGGQAGSFRGKMENLDGELFVRSAQCSALMPMMQFSAAPWRVLSRAHADLCIEAAKLHAKFANKIIALSEHAAQTCEPIARYMEYVFPGQSLAEVTNQFMLGDKILVAPVIEKGAVTRKVILPNGSWRYQDGTVYEGGVTVEVPAPLDVLPYFELV